MTERDEARDRACGDRTDDRDHLEDSGEDGEQDRERDLEERQPDEGGRRHHPDEEQLAAHVAPEEGVHVGDERNEFVALAAREDPPDPLEETRGVPQQEERRDEEDEELEQEVPEADDERDRVASDHLAEIGHARERDDHLIEVLEAQLVCCFGQGVLGVDDERRQRPLQLAQLFDDERHKDPSATYYGCKKADKDDERRERPREREPALEERDPWEQHVGDDRRPNERANDVAGTIEDEDRGDGEQADDDTLRRRAPPRAHMPAGLSAPREARRGSDR